jgi:hypothetical protein
MVHIITTQLLRVNIFYGCKLWSFTLTDKQELLVLANKILRKIFRPSRTDRCSEIKLLYKNDTYPSQNYYLLNNEI